MGYETDNQALFVGTGVVLTAAPLLMRYVRSRRWLIVPAENVSIQDNSGPSPSRLGTRWQGSYEYRFDYRVHDETLHGTLASENFWGTDFKIRVNQKNTHEFMYARQGIWQELLLFVVGALSLLIAIAKLA